MPMQVNKASDRNNHRRNPNDSLDDRKQLLGHVQQGSSDCGESIPNTTDVSSGDEADDVAYTSEPPGILKKEGNNVQICSASVESGSMSGGTFSDARFKSGEINLTSQETGLIEVEMQDESELSSFEDDIEYVSMQRKGKGITVYQKER